MSACTRFLCVAALLGSATTAAAEAKEVRNVGRFNGIHVSNGITVNSTVGGGPSLSLSIEGDGGVLGRVLSSVDFWGILVISLPGGSAGVVANVTVPEPLTYAGVSAGGILIADSVAGAVVATSHGKIYIENLTAVTPTSVSASSNGNVSISGGNVGYASVSCSDHSSIQLHDLQANTASVSVSYKSLVKGMTVGAMALSVSSASSAEINATRAVGLSCSDSSVSLNGSANVTTLANHGCSINGKTSAAQAEFYP